MGGHAEIHFPREKAKDAAAYVIAFEFQLWSGYGVDETPGRRELKMYEDVKQFFLDIEDCVATGDVNPLVTAGDPLNPTALKIKMPALTRWRSFWTW